jgi:polyisoprenoid-binding protein YceI
MKKTSLLLLATAALALPAYAAPTTFDFKDPKGVNNVIFQLDAPLESINGTANGVSGTITVDPENVAATKGKISVTTESLTVPNAMMKEHMLGEQWLNAKKNPEISFEVKSLSDIETKGNVTEADVTGTFTLNGVSKEITVEAKVTYLPGKLGDRTGGKVQGDLVVIRSEFQIKRSDYNIQPGQNEEKVGDVIELKLAIAGAAPKS